MVVELVLDWENINRGAREQSVDHWVGVWSPLQEVVVNVELFTNCSKQERGCASELASLRALAHLKERKGEWPQNRKHACNLLSH